MGRNTTIVRSNYLLPANTHFYEHSMKLWEGLSRDLNYNVMFSQRGVLNLAHSDGQKDAYARRGNAMRLNGVDSELLDRDGVRRLYPYLDFSETARFRSEEHTSELQSLMRISYAVFCLQQKKTKQQ